MPEVLDYDTPIRPINPGPTKPVPGNRPPEAPPAPGTFFAELRKILAGRLVR